jgi:hypothetical protein
VPINLVTLVFCFPVPASPSHHIITSDCASQRAFVLWTLNGQSGSGYSGCNISRGPGRFTAQTRALQKLKRGCRRRTNGMKAHSIWRPISKLAALQNWSHVPLIETVQRFH